MLSGRSVCQTPYGEENDYCMESQKGGLAGRSVGQIPYGEESAYYMESQKGGFGGRSDCQTPYGEESVDYMESQKGGLPEGRLAKHHMGRRVCIIWSPNRRVFRTVGLPTTIWEGESL